MLPEGVARRCRPTRDPDGRSPRHAWHALCERSLPSSTDRLRGHHAIEEPAAPGPVVTGSSQRAACGHGRRTGGTRHRARARQLQLEDDQRLWQGRAVLHGRPGQRHRPRQTHRGDVRRAAEDPGVRRRRADPGARRLRRRACRHRGDEPRQQLLLDRQDVCRAVLHRGAVRPELPGHQRLALRRRRPTAVERGLRAVRHGGACPAATPACR